MIDLYVSKGQKPPRHPSKSFEQNPLARLDRLERTVLPAGLHDLFPPPLDPGLRRRAITLGGTGGACGTNAFLVSTDVYGTWEVYIAMGGNAAPALRSGGVETSGPSEPESSDSEQSSGMLLGIGTGGVV